MVDENYSTGIVEDYVHDSGKLWRNWGMLALHTAVDAIIAVAALEFVDRDKR